MLIAPVLTGQGLAELVGTTLDTVSRTIAEWENERVLRSLRWQLLVRSPGRLEALARAVA